MIDHNVWLGHWPFRDLGLRGESRNLLEIMDRLEIAQSWVSPLDGIFHRVPHLANRWLFEQTARQPDRLKAVPIFNPGLADAADYLEWLGKQNPRPSAIRLYPAMHDIHPEMVEDILQKIAESGFTVILTHRLVDPRARHPQLPLPQYSLDQTREWIEALSSTPLILAGFNMEEVLKLHQAGVFALSPEARFETSFLDGASCMEKGFAAMGENGLIPGSNAPLIYQEAMISKWKSPLAPPLVSTAA